MRYLVFILLFCLSTTTSFSQKKKKASKANSEEKTLLEKTSFRGMKFRSIGPGITSGRISDFAMTPDNYKEYYVATSSGGVWKTSNNGNTYEPIFDSQGSYSIGCITMDPNNSNILWVGTGENNNQRSVAYGDGIYKSEDGGISWQHKGLKKSEHIGKIIVHPNNSQIVYVAAIGPLWSSGGERGVYKTIDGGDNWELVLKLDEYTGANDIIMDPRDPDILYAAAFQRGRHVWTYLGGGPGSTIYKTMNGGGEWKKVEKGLPSVDKGRIGLAIAPSNPEVLYAIVEAAKDKSGFFRSTNRGASWSKMSNKVTSGNYYQEIVVDPVDEDVIYSMDTYMHVSQDGGKSWSRVPESAKHVDNHCLWINPEDTDHMVAGCDGGIYETWDGAAHWHFKPNLPITQFYKLAIDNAYPFYNVYGGTQDNYSFGGPTRSQSASGISNDEWFIVHGGDGFKPQVDPIDPNIVYAQHQYGVLFRFDRKSGEQKGIQPFPAMDENEYRWNWDAPLAISKHDNKRIYFAANKLFRSDDQGDTWRTLGDDLTAQIDRNKLKIMGRVWGVDAVVKHRSTSPFGTIVAFSESPINENLLYIGTDDGLIQVSEDGGKTWRKKDHFSGVPNMTYVNAIYASNHDENTVYACFNHHKYGDFKPYVYKSTDKGISWTSISNNLPERGSAYCIVEDFVSPNLLFVGTEFGLHTSYNSGKEWKQLSNGIPTIAIRDIEIQAREGDLVLASFGRGFYVLDDLSPLRKMSLELLKKDNYLFPMRNALSFLQSSPVGRPGKGFRGDNFYIGENLPPAAIFHYYLKDVPKTRMAEREKNEADKRKDYADLYNPSYDDLVEEKYDQAPYILWTITNENNDVVRKMKSSASKGLNRVYWDMRFASKWPAGDNHQEANPFNRRATGNLVPAGIYEVSAALIHNDTITEIGKSQTVEIISLDNKSIKKANDKALASFQLELDYMSRDLQKFNRELGEVSDKLPKIKAALFRTEEKVDFNTSNVTALTKQIDEIEKVLFGDDLAFQLDQPRKTAIQTRLGRLMYFQRNTTTVPSQHHMDQLEIIKTKFDAQKDKLVPIKKMVDDMINSIYNAGGPLVD